MSSRKFSALLSLVLTSLTVPSAWAQDPFRESNRDRAYRHFLTSTAPVRTFSSLQPGGVWGYDTPLESVRFWQTPGYYHERIYPWGRERYAVPVWSGVTVIQRPVVIPQPLFVPPGYPAPYPGRWNPYLFP